MFNKPLHLSNNDNGQEPEPITTEIKILALVCHLAPTLGIVIIVPLGVLLWKGRQSNFLTQHVVEALNFQISVTIYGCLSLASFYFVAFGWRYLAIPISLLLALLIYILVVASIASVQAINHKHYRYPLIIRFVQ
jgi:hypothetical protein